MNRPASTSIQPFDVSGVIVGGQAEVWNGAVFPLLAGDGHHILIRSVDHSLDKVRDSISVRVQLAHRLFISCAGFGWQIFKPIEFFSIDNNLHAVHESMAGGDILQDIRDAILILIGKIFMVSNASGIWLLVCISQRSHCLFIFLANVRRHVLHAVIGLTIDHNNFWIHCCLH